MTGELGHLINGHVVGSLGKIPEVMIDMKIDEEISKKIESFADEEFHVAINDSMREKIGRVVY